MGAGEGHRDGSPASLPKVRLLNCSKQHARVSRSTPFLFFTHDRRRQVCFGPPADQLAITSCVVGDGIGGVWEREGEGGGGGKGGVEVEVGVERALKVVYIPAP